MLVLGIVLGTVAAGVAMAGGDDQRKGKTKVASATLVNGKGDRIGRARLVQFRGRITVTGTVKGVTPGFHGFHVHAVGRCDPRAVDPATGTVVPFFTAGGHLNPGGTTHGRHAGDLPVLYVSADGTARSTVDTDALTLAAIFDADGAAVIVHALPDNLAHIPTRYSAGGVAGPDTLTQNTGDAGGRVACGVITR
jgi:superoxide dismutase, Cu-Zn family